MIEVKETRQAAAAIKAKRWKFYISAGHRGKGTGASGNGIDEGVEAIWVRDQVSEVLRSLGYRVENDKNTDQLSAVVKGINATAEPEDISLDIHFNAAGKTATGVECLVREAARVTEKTIAIDMCQRISKTLGIKNRGVKTDNQGQHSRLAMCSDIRCNALLVEICFISNSDDAARYKDSRLEIVRDIVDSLVKTRS